MSPVVKTRLEGFGLGLVAMFCFVILYGWVRTLQEGPLVPPAKLWTSPGCPPCTPTAGVDR